MGARKYTDIAIRGTVYADARAAADALGITPGQVRLAARRGRLDLAGLGSGRRAVVIRGVRYASFAAAGRALGVAANTVAAAARAGTLHRVGTGRVGVEPMRVEIAGRVFDSARAAAEHYGRSVMTIYSAIADGDPDRVARARVFEIGGLRFASMREASRALGFSNPEFVAQVVKSGSRRGWQRILGAAMRLAARGGGNGQAAAR